MPAVFIAERAGLVLYLNRVEIRFVRGVRHILSGDICVGLGSVPGCIVTRQTDMFIFINIAY